MGRLYMGVDLGTSFIKAAVYDIHGKSYASASEPVKDERPAPGMFLQHGEQLFSSVCNCMRTVAIQLGERAKDIAAIAFTGQMAGSMGVDEQWNDVTTWSCSLDSRYLPYSRRQLQTYGEEFYQLSGTSSPVMCGKIEWFRDKFPKEAARIRKYVMLNGYIIGKLADLNISEAAIDHSLIAWTGLADVRQGCWSDKICRELGIDKQILPVICSCTEIGGCLSEKAAAILGLSSGIPLVLGAGDKVAGCIGAAVTRDGEKIFEASSYAALSMQVDSFWPDLEQKEFDIIGNIRSDRFFVHKYLQGSGITLNWFVQEFVRSEEETAKEAFARIEKAAAQVSPGSDKMIAVGLLGGSAMPFQPDQKGLFFGHTWAHRKGHFYRALLEGFSYELCALLERVDKLYPEYAGGSIKLIGGGAKSSIWPQMMADVTGRTFTTLDRQDVALWGAALLGAAGIGDVDDIHARAAEAVHSVREYRPSLGATEHYAPYVETYKRLRRELQPYYAALSQLP